MELAPQSFRAFNDVLEATFGPCLSPPCPTLLYGRGRANPLAGAPDFRVDLGRSEFLMTENGPDSRTPLPTDRRVSELEREIAAQKQVEQRSVEVIQDGEVRYRRLFESTGDAIMLLGAAGFLDCNEATLQLFGCPSHQEFVSKHPSEVSPPSQPDGTDSRTAANDRIAQAYREELV